MQDLFPLNLLIVILVSQLSALLGMMLGVFFAVKILSIKKPSYWLWLLTLILITIGIGAIGMAIFSTLFGSEAAGAIAAAALVILTIGLLMNKFYAVPILKSATIVLITGAVTSLVMVITNLLLAPLQ